MSVRFKILILAALFLGLLCPPPLVADDIVCITCSRQVPGTRRRESRRPRLSGDGRFVVFDSKKKLTADDSDRYSDVYLYDAATRVITLIHPGHPKRGNREPFISRDGESIAYVSEPPHVLPNTSPTADVYLFHRRTQENRLMTVGVGSGPHNGFGAAPFLAKGSALVMFTSNATNLTVNNSKPIRQVYLFNKVSGVLSGVSHNSDGIPANRPCVNAKISADGRFIAFKTAATNLIPDVPLESLAGRLYLWDRSAERPGPLIVVDQAERGFDGDSWISGQFDVSNNGDIVFEGRARRGPDQEKTLKRRKLFLFSYETGRVNLLESLPGGENVLDPAVTPDGRLLVFAVGNSNEGVNDAGIFMHEFSSGQTARLVRGACRSPVISSNGRAVAFESQDVALVGKAEKGIVNILMISNNKF